MLEPTLAKIIPFENARAHFESLRAQGRVVVHSHGIFDLMHPGHIAHLEGAKALGDVLVVSVTSDRHVHKGPGRPYFKEQLRLHSLAALACVDYVVLIPFAGAVEAIETIRAHIYCKGKEYEDPDYDDSGGLEEEVRAVEQLGGEVRFVGAIKSSSTKLLNLYFEHPGAPVHGFCSALALKHTRRSLVEAVDSLADLRVLVVGETILDRYSEVKVQGLTTKSQILSGRFLGQETHCGGALAVFRHVRQFTENVRFLSVVGNEPWVEPLLTAHVAPREDLVIRDPSSTTIIKERFVEPRRAGEEVSKLFAVNYLDAEPPATATQSELERRLRAAVAECDVVLALDFGHGLFQAGFREVLQDIAPFLALNCQTNSNNHGFNIISRQYRRADAFTLDEQELLLSAGRRHLDFQKELRQLQEQFGARYAWLTRGPAETVGLADDPVPCLCPALEFDVLDPVGAGDAFFAIAALAAARKLPIDLATFLGQLAAAQAVRIIGNAQPVAKQVLVRAGMSLLER